MAFTTTISKQNANDLGAKIEAAITGHRYVGADTPDGIDFLAVVAALTTILRHTVMQVPPQFRLSMVETAIATLEVARRDSSEAKVRKQ